VPYSVIRREASVINKELGKAWNEAVIQLKAQPGIFMKHFAPRNKIPGE
jgi:hypothetical protein